MVQLLTTLYDMTNDDDDVIRDEAAAVTAKVWQACSTGAACEVQMPLLAGDMIAALLARRYTGNAQLAEIGMRKLTGQRDLETVPAESVLHADQQTATALFAIEKQNLFIDPAREARLWSRVLMKLHPSAFSPKLVADLTRWTLAGLDALMHKATTAPGGSLSWARKPDTFTYGLQAFYAAEVLLHLHRVDSRKAVPVQQMRSSLAQLLGVEKRRDLNPLWRTQLEGVLLRAIVPGVQKVAHALSAVSRRLDYRES